MKNKFKDNTPTSYTLIPEPDPVGGYRIGKIPTGYIQFNLTHKPKWIHRQFMRILLGWYWYDNK
jgi:hypothetical protein